MDSYIFSDHARQTHFATSPICMPATIFLIISHFPRVSDGVAHCVKILEIISETATGSAKFLMVDGVT